LASGVLIVATAGVTVIVTLMIAFVGVLGVGLLEQKTRPD